MAEAAALREQAAHYRRMMTQIDDAKAKEALKEASEKLEGEAARLETETSIVEGAKRTFYSSENGDVWFLAVSASGSPRIVHQANAASGGRETQFEVDTFLTTSGRHTPQHAGLLRLIASLVERRDATDPCDCGHR